MSCVYHAFASLHCYLVVTCWERADLLALVCDVKLCFVTFPYTILGQVWYLKYRFLIFATFFILVVYLLEFAVFTGSEYCWDGKNSTAYKGDHSVTRSGRTCQEWTSNSPHQSLYQDDFNFPLDGYSATSAKNYCRDPGGEEDGSPWCYTKDPLTEWEYCDPPTCQSTLLSLLFCYY